MNKFNYIHLILILAFYFSCGSNNESYTVEMVDGVRTVHNIKPLWGDEPEVVLEFVQQFGFFNHENENYMFFRPSDITLDDEDNIYILDSGNFRIQKFDLQGNYILTISKEGEGPGELLRPNSIDIGSDNLIYVNNAGNNRFEVFGLDGTFESSIKRQGGSFMRVTNSGNFVTGKRTGLVFGRLEIDENNRYYGLLRHINSDGSELNKIGKPDTYVIEAPPAALVEIMYVLENSTNFTIDNSDNVFAAYTYSNRIDKFSLDGNLIMCIIRPLNYVPTRAVFDDMVSRYPTMISNGIEVDSKNRLWVLGYKRAYYFQARFRPPEEAEESSIDDLYELVLLDDEGHLLGSINIDKYPSNIRIYEDRLFLIDERNSMSIYEYRIIEK